MDRLVPASAAPLPRTDRPAAAAGDRIVHDASQPLVLIAQITRSGGSLLAQLLDGHDALHCHPPELLIGGGSWPELDVNLLPERLFDALRERHLSRAFTDGYFKDRPARKLALGQPESFPFDLDPEEHRRLFVRLCATQRPATTRAVLSHYFTALFNAWPGNRNLGGDKRWVVVFRNKLGQDGNLQRFFDEYPDGRHLTCAREPKARTASTIRFHDERRRPLQSYIDKWRAAAERQLKAAETHGERVFLVRFESLVLATEPTMRRLSAWLDIGYQPILARPTFNRADIKANSSFVVNSPGIIDAPVENWRSVLTPEEGRAIDAQTSDLYAEIVRRAHA